MKRYIRAIWMALLGLLILTTLTFATSFKVTKELTYDNIHSFIPLKELSKYGLERDSVITNLFIDSQGNTMFVVQRMKGKDALLVRFNVFTGKSNIIELKGIKRISKIAYLLSTKGAVLYSLFGGKLYYVKDNVIIPLTDPTYTLFIPGDSPFMWLYGSPYVLTRAAFRDRKGRTDGKLYTTLITPSDSHPFRKVISERELKARLSSLLSKEGVNVKPKTLSIVGLGGSGNHIVFVVRSPNEDYVVEYDLRKRSISNYLPFHRVIQYSIVGGKMLMLDHEKGLNYSDLILLDLKTFKPLTVTKEKVFSPMLSEKYISYTILRDEEEIYLVNRPIDDLNEAKTYKLSVSLKNAYLRVLDNDYLVINDNKGFYVWKL